MARHLEPFVPLDDITFPEPDLTAAQRIVDTIRPALFKYWKVKRVVLGSDGSVGFRMKKHPHSRITTVRITQLESGHYLLECLYWRIHRKGQRISIYPILRCREIPLDTLARALRHAVGLHRWPPQAELDLPTLWTI